MTAQGLSPEKLADGPAETPDRRRPFIEPGWYHDLANEEYHGSFGLSSSNLKVLLEHTPAHLEHSFAVPTEPSANMQLGTAVHTMVLEPDTVKDEIVIAPEVNRRTNAGKAEWLEFEAASVGKIGLKQEDYNKARRMADSVMAHPIAGILLRDAVPESSIYWWYRSMDPDDDIQYREMLKVRPDALCRSHPVIVDLKTTVDATYSGFIRSTQRYHYHVSAAMYLEGVNQCRPLLDELGRVAFTKFLFVCVESAEPYLTAVYELSDEYLDIGKTLYRRALRTLRDAREAEEFPGFPDEVRVLEPPGWARRGHVV